MKIGLVCPYSMARGGGVQEIVMAMRTRQDFFAGFHTAIDAKKIVPTSRLVSMLTGIHVQRKTNLGGTLLVHKAMQAGQVDLYVEYTGTALNAVLNESPTGDSAAVYQRVKQLYAQRFQFARNFNLFGRG